MIDPPAWILSTGARCPLGLSATQVAMCVRAMKLEPLTTRFLDKNGEAIGAGRMLGLPETIFGYERLLRIAAPALCEAWPTGIDEAIPVILALPDVGRADDEPRFGDRLLRDLAARSRRRVDLDRSITIRAGHAGGALAFEAALLLLARPGGPTTVVVGGVDSYFHPDVLAALDRELRLHAPGAEDGFIPAEGAAFARICRRAPKRGEAPPLAAIRRVLTCREATVGTDQPAIAAAMTSIFHALRDEGPIPWVLTDLNGEAWRLREWMLVQTRVLARDEIVHAELVGELGDLGAATGPMLLAIACAYLDAKCAPALEAVIALSSEGAERGAIRIEAAS